MIRPSQSPFSSSILLVRKLGGSWRMYINYKVLTEATIKDKYPFLVMDELLDKLFGFIVFSKLDLKSSYHQIYIKADDIHKIAFSTQEGHYKFFVTSFGLTNAPSTF